MDTWIFANTNLNDDLNKTDVHEDSMTITNITQSGNLKKFEMVQIKYSFVSKFN